MVLIAKETFVGVNDKCWFVFFDKGKSYEVISSFYYPYLMINGCQFSFDRLNDYFYSDKEFRKLKLDKLNSL